MQKDSVGTYNIVKPDDEILIEAQPEQEKFTESFGSEVKNDNE